MSKYCPLLRWFHFTQVGRHEHRRTFISDEVKISQFSQLTRGKDKVLIFSPQKTASWRIQIFPRYAPCFPSSTGLIVRRSSSRKSNTSWRASTESRFVRAAASWPGPDDGSGIECLPRTIDCLWDIFWLTEDMAASASSVTLRKTRPMVGERCAAGSFGSASRRDRVSKRRDVM